MGNHSAAITAMDMAVHRTLIITACKASAPVLQEATMISAFQLYLV